MRRFRHSTNSDSVSTVDISPLIDVVFLLLIFFIVTTVFVKETGVEVSKPRAASSEDLQKQAILIAVTDEGRVWHGGFDKALARDLLRRQKRIEPLLVMAIALPYPVPGEMPDQTRNHANPRQLLELGQLQLEALRVDDVVGVHAGHEWSRAQFETGVEGLHQTRLGSVYDSYTNVLGSPIVEDLRRAVGRTIVHRDHLVLLERLAPQTRDAVLQVRAGIAHGKENGNQWL